MTVSPAMGDGASPKSLGDTLSLGAASAAGGSRLSTSASAPAFVGRKGVQILIDPASPPRDGQLQDVDTMLVPDDSMFATDTSPRHASSKAAWGSPGSPSRPGSRGKWSSRSSSSSVSRGAGGRFTPDEALCFRRMPTPSSSCQTKREQYWQVGGSGQKRRELAESNFHLLPVLKGKFYSHPKLCDTPTRRSVERGRSQRHHKKREQSHNANRVESLPDELLTATVLEEIYPKTPTMRPSSSGRLGEWTLENDFEHVATSPSSPSHEKMKSLVEARKQLKNNAMIIKRLSASDPKSQDGAKQDLASNDLGAITHTSSSPDVKLAGTMASIGVSTTALAGTKDKAALVAAAGQAIMLEFRKQVLEKYHTVKQGFDAFSIEVPAAREMTKKEWRRVLSKLGFVSTTEERDAIFEQLDINGNGHVSMAEFHIAIEAAAPVRTMEDLRRRWLASNFSSMAQAISIMDEGGATSNRRLSLKEFGEALCRVHVAEHGEHVAIFNAIVDANDRSTKVSIGELASAIATVSPAMFLEDIRHRLLKKYGGQVEKAFWDLDPDHSGMVSLTEFCKEGPRRLGLTEMEAIKIFRGIDVDGSGQVTKSEFLCALCMSEPSIFYEDLRKKIRQRYRSIQGCFAVQLEDPNNTDLHQNPKLTFHRFQEILKEMELSEVDLRTLFELIDANGDGALTIREFNQGVRHFAPSCVLEDLRVQCLMRHETVSDVFVSTLSRNEKERVTPLDLKAFESLLEAHKLTAGVQVQAIFDLLDVRNEGYVSLGKLIAALQSGGPGCTARLPDEERDQKAEQDIKLCMMTHHKFVGDLKTLVRSNPKAPEEPHNARKQTSIEASGEDADHNPHGGSLPAGSEFRGKKDRSGIGITCRAAWKEAGGGAPMAQAHAGSPPRPASQEKHRAKDASSNASAAGADEEGAIPLSNVAPRLRALPQEELAKYMAKLDCCRIMDHKKIAQDPVAGAQHTWGRVWDCLHKCPGQKDREVVEKRLLDYFQTQTKGMSHDMPLLERSHSRYAIHKSVRAHTKALAQQRGLKG